MARPRKPLNEVKEVVGLRLLPATITELEALATQYHKTKGWAARQIFEFGLTMMKSMEQNGLPIDLRKFGQEAIDEEKAKNKKLAA